MNATETTELDDHLPIRKGDRLEGFECPRCGESYDSLMDRPAVKSAGFNRHGGLLFDCSCCGKRITEAEIRTGLSRPWNSDDMGGFEPDREQYIRPGGPRDSPKEDRGEVDG